LTDDLLKDKRDHESADYSKAKASQNTPPLASKLESEATQSIDKITDEFKKATANKVNQSSSNQTIKVSQEDLKKTLKV